MIQDCEDTPAPTTPRKKATPCKPKIDADGNTIVKTPKQAATPKLDANGNPVVVKTTKESTAKRGASVKFEDGEQGEPVGQRDNGNAEEAKAPATPSSKKRGGKSAEPDTPSKRQKATPIPNTKAEMSEADKMMMEWKESGKTWTEINAEWTRITGQPVGKSTLGVRYIKLKAAFVELEDGDIGRVIFGKEIIDKLKAEEIAAFQQKQTDELSSFIGATDRQAWARLSVMLPKLGGVEYSGEALSKAYSKEKRDGFPHQEAEAMAALRAGNFEDVGIEVEEDTGAEESGESQSAPGSAVMVDTKIEEAEEEN